MTRRLRLLLLAHAFNGLTQRLHVALRDAGHEVSLELDIADAVTEEAVALYRPDLLIAPFLKRRIPETVWRALPCLVVHPGPPGDRGPAALDWAVLQQRREWGVTVLQATADFDAGPVWAWRHFAVREGASKASLYRQEVTHAATQAVLDAVGAFADGAVAPPAMPPRLPDLGWRGPVPATERAIDWRHDDTASVLRKLNSADGHPGVADILLGTPCRLFDGHAASAASLQSLAGAPGEVLARRGPALLRKTVDAGVWIGHLRVDLPGAQGSLKLAATRALAPICAALPELSVPLQHAEEEWDELRYHEREVAPGVLVGWLDFNFHNGALSARQGQRLCAALDEVRQRPTRVLVLAGGTDFFCNGIHLHDIEASAHGIGCDGPDSAADASWRNINAIDDVALAVLQLTDRLTVAALRGNAGAGGCWLALAADRVWAHGDVVLNPHYKNMGNLYGSEYWTYTLPRRVGPARAAELTHRLMQGRLPTGAAEARALGLVDAVLAPQAGPAFEAAVWREATALALHNAGSGWTQAVAAKQARRAADETAKPLAAYRQEELNRMQRNFYGFDPSYHVARHHFVHRKPQAWTPRHLALHR